MWWTYNAIHIVAQYTVRGEKMFMQTAFLRCLVADLTSSNKYLLILVTQVNIVTLSSIPARRFESKCTLCTVTSELLYALHKPFPIFEWNSIRLCKRVVGRFWSAAVFTKYEDYLRKKRNELACAANLDWKFDWIRSEIYQFTSFVRSDFWRYGIKATVHMANCCTSQTVSLILFKSIWQTFLTKLRNHDFLFQPFWPITKPNLQKPMNAPPSNVTHTSL